jgi:hypothetical protein
MEFGRRGLFEDIAATVLVAGTVLGYAATHEQWNVWLIGDSHRWTTALLCLLALGMLALVTRHIGATATVLLGAIAAGLAAVAFWTASLTPLSLLGVTIIVAWAFAVLRDVRVVQHKPASTS